jgi:two-component system, response regulator PdtaR
VASSGSFLGPAGVRDVSIEAAALGRDPASGRTILLVEDEVLVRIALADELRDMGLPVIEVSNADEALRVLQAAVPIGLVLTDVHMPGTLDGLGLAARLRADHPGVKVVVASGHLPSEVAARHDLDAFFEKPYAFATVARHLRDMLD